MISKETVLDMLDAISVEVEEGYGFQHNKWRERVLDMPSVEPERKKKKMTLDEAIIHCEETSKFKSEEGQEARLQEQDKYADECFKCALEHKQLADWLKMLQRILKSGDCNECAIQKMCNVRPEWGEQVRYNCHMFVRKEVKE